MDRIRGADSHLDAAARSPSRAAASDPCAMRVRGFQELASIKPEFRYELLASFARGEVNAAVTIWSLSVIFGRDFARLGAVARKLCLAARCHRRKGRARRAVPPLPRRSNAEADLDVWYRRLFLAELLCGCTWAGFSLVGVGDAVESDFALLASHVFIFTGLMVLLAMRITFATAVTAILYAGTVPMTVAVVVRLCFIGEPLYYALAAMAAGVHVYFALLSLSLRHTQLQMLDFARKKTCSSRNSWKQKHIAEEARSRAEAGSVAKSRFLATMSHELRTPLNAILGFSEVMKDELFGQHAVPTYREYSNDIHDSGRHLLNLINEILDLSRIEAGRYELKEERSHIGDIAEDCMRLLKLRAQRRGFSTLSISTRSCRRCGSIREPFARCASTCFRTR